MYKLGEGSAEVTVHSVDGSTMTDAGNALDTETSDALFRRLGTVALIEVAVTESSLSNL